MLIVFYQNYFLLIFEETLLLVDENELSENGKEIYGYLDE
jgi:hypothetical protein